MDEAERPSVPNLPFDPNPYLEVSRIHPRALDYPLELPMKRGKVAIGLKIDISELLGAIELPTRLVPGR